MTLKERVIVETYTGYCMTSGDEREETYKYMAELMGRPVFTHEIPKFEEELRKRSEKDFIALCGRPITNGDKIRAMTDEELVELINDTIYECQPDYCRDKDCRKCIEKWLREVAE